MNAVTALRESIRWGSQILDMVIADATPEQLRAAALAALKEWRTVEHHPLSSRPTQIAARAAARTIEGLLTV